MEGRDSSEAFRGARVLIVEDEFIIANDLRNILNHLGYQVVGMVDNYDEAILRIDEGDVDLALIDILLKGLKSGIDLAKTINTTSGIPFIFVTSHTDESTLNKAKSTGPYGYIVKPFEGREILASIEIALYKKENENISRQEFEKNLLLELSKDLSQVTSKSEIKASVETRLSGILPNLLRMSVMLSSTEDSKSSNYFEEPAAVSATVESEGEDPFRQHLLGIERIEELSISQLVKAFEQSPMFQQILRDQILRLVAMPIVLNGGRRGVALLHFTGLTSLPRAANVLDGVSELLSMAISNMMADEEISRSQALQQLQIDLANSLNNRAAVRDQLQDMVKVLESVFSFQMAVFYTHSETQQRMLVFNKVGFDEYQVLDESAILNIVGVKRHRPKALFPKVSEDVQTASADVGGIRGDFMARYGIQSILHLPISHASDGCYCLEICSKLPEAFAGDKKELGRRLKSTLRLLLDNIFAFEAINDLTDELQNEKQYLMEELASSFRLDGMTSHSEEMQEVITRIETVANTDASVLILGETGTGKELTARAIHRNSSRRDKPFIKINCAAIPSQLIESELFGHEKGAFTGAHDRRIGKFELANKGTLFLDEIGEMPLDLQPKLLRAIQEREFERLGSNKTLQADIRLICATNRNLSEEVTKSTFRADLFYRISVFPVELPRLRDRAEDIEPLANQFARELCEKQGSGFLGFDEETLRNFNTYDWPGNIRELRNVVEQLCILYRNKPMHWDMPAGRVRFGTTAGHTIDEPQDLQSNIRQTERDGILQALRKTGGRIRGEQGAAALLGLKPTTLEYRIRKLDITKEEIFDWS